MYHRTVLLHEAVAALKLRPGGTYVDLTFGGGGHSREILSQLDSTARLFAFDQDPDAQDNLPEDDRLVFIPENFRHISSFLRLQGVREVDGILADLGVSSHQFDTAERGFSTRFEGPLDMRMDPESGMSAAELVASASEAELHRILGEYGELRNARTVAKRIVERRRQLQVRTTRELQDLLSDLVIGPAPRYWAQLFQALRMEVNEEMKALCEMMEQSLGLLCSGGRLAIITFHSVEDRLVKHFMQWGMCKGEPERDLYGRFELPIRRVGRKPILPTEEEIKENPRSRSAKLRVAEKI